MIKKFYTKLFFSSIAISFLLIAPVQAAILNPNLVGDIGNNTNALGVSAGYDQSATVGSVVAIVIKSLLGLLGVIFVVLLIVAGFNWMTANGDEAKIEKAKDTIRTAVIGLIIVVSAYAVTYFIFANLPGAGSGGTLSGN